MKVKLFKTLNIVMETIVHIPSFVDDTTSLFHALRTQLRWERHNFFKRMICHYMGESHELNILVQTIERTFNRQVEGVFLNYYEDGNDYAPYHADKYNCNTCLVSLGTMRTLRFKHNTTEAFPVSMFRKSPNSLCAITSLCGNGSPTWNTWCLTTPGSCYVTICCLH